MIISLLRCLHYISALLLLLCSSALLLLQVLSAVLKLLKVGRITKVQEQRMSIVEATALRNMATQVV